MTEIEVIGAGVRCQQSTTKTIIFSFISLIYDFAVGPHRHNARRFPPPTANASERLTRGFFLCAFFDTQVVENSL
jgi:hypothetical protein